MDGGDTLGQTREGGTGAGDGNGDARRAPGDERDEEVGCRRKVRKTCAFRCPQVTQGLMDANRIRERLQHLTDLQ